MGFAAFSGEVHKIDTMRDHDTAPAGAVNRCIPSVSPLTPIRRDHLED